MDFATFESRCQSAGFGARECSDVHWQVTNGDGRPLVNYWPTKSKALRCDVQDQRASQVSLDALLALADRAARKRGSVTSTNVAKAQEAVAELKARDHQEGGDHYKSLPIQPVEYIHANGLGFIEGCVVKYVTRHRAKGKAEDIRKAIHFLELLLELEYGKESQ